MPTTRRCGPNSGVGADARSDRPVTVYSQRSTVQAGPCDARLRSAIRYAASVSRYASACTPARSNNEAMTSKVSQS